LPVLKNNGIIKRTQRIKTIKIQEISDITIKNTYKSMNKKWDNFELTKYEKEFSR